MFIPRQLQKKDPKPQQRSSAPIAASTKRPTKDDQTDLALAKELVMTLEMLFSDYGIENSAPEWFPERARSLEGESDFIHLSALLDSPLLAQIKPKPSQVSLMKALIQCPSSFLRLSKDKYHIRREGEHSKFSRFSKERREYLEGCTIYIEPHITGITSNPGRIARMLSESGLPEEYLPVQFVDGSHPAWAFVILSSTVSQKDAESCKLWPKDWIVMTNEWRKRDEEYQQLRRSRPAIPNNTRPWESNDTDTGLLAQRSRPDKLVMSSLVDLVPLRASDPGKNCAFDPGLIIYLTNLHPSSKKEVITGFITRQVDRYLRKQKIPKSRENPTTTHQGRDDPPSLSINYVDYQKGLTTGYVRLQRKHESELVVAALKKRQRRMRDGDDRKGKKALTGKKEGDWVEATIVEGAEEEIYWERVLSAKGKGKGKRKRPEPPIPTPPDTTGPPRRRCENTRAVDDRRCPKKIRFEN